MRSVYSWQEYTDRIDNPPTPIVAAYTRVNARDADSLVFLKDTFPIGWWFVWHLKKCLSLMAEFVSLIFGAFKPPFTKSCCSNSLLILPLLFFVVGFKFQMNLYTILSILFISGSLMVVVSTEMSMSLTSSSRASI